MYYSAATPRPLQMTSIPQGQQNPTVANMSNAQNSHGQSIIVQSQPMEMPANSQPLQVPQQPTTTPMPDTRHIKRKNAAIKIINPATGNEIILNDMHPPPPPPPPVIKYLFTKFNNILLTTKTRCKNPNFVYAQNGLIQYVRNMD